MRTYLVMLMLLCGVLLGTMATTSAYAQSAPAAAPTGGTQSDGATDPQQCTSFQERFKKTVDENNSDKPGLLTEIYNFIKKTVGSATEKLFGAFVNSDVYKEAVFGALSLMVVIFGIGFTMGIIQPSFQQVLVRLIKFGIILTLISPGGWNFFNENVVKFFVEGTDDLVRGVLAIGTGDTSVPAGASPFYELDKLAEFVLNPETIIALLGSFFNGGPFGASMGGLLAISIWVFVSLLITALRTYALSYVAKALILGVAPIFIIFLLFDKTKNLFMAWVNALVNLSLRPILLFTFLSFFLVMMESATKDMLNVELCWSDSKVGTEGMATPAFWTFKGKDGKLMQSQQSWKGSLDCIITGKECSEFPINVIDILTFLILMYIGYRFSSVTESMATDLSNAVISLDAAGRLEQFISQSGKGAAGGGGIAAQQRSDAKNSGGGGAQRSTGATAPQNSPRDAAPSAQSQGTERREAALQKLSTDERARFLKLEGKPNRTQAEDEELEALFNR